MKPSVKKISLIVITILMVALPVEARALLKSANYLIYETVLQDFDGPVISNVAQTAGDTTATVSWDTDVVSDGFVIYDTSAGFTAPKEQGSSAKVSTAQSVTLVGLSSGTTYYFRLRSQSLYGGSTTDNTVRSFTTSTPPPAPVTPAPSPGGGAIIIDKTDKFPPKITAVTVAKLMAESATITWQTDEVSNSFVGYGEEPTYGSTYGQWDSTKEHSVTLINLAPETKYYFRAMSADSWGNLASSTGSSFTTLSFEEEEKQEAAKPPSEKEEPTVADLTAALERARELIARMAQQVTIGVLESNLTKHMSALEVLTNFLPAPFFSAEPKIEVEATTATVAWGTNVDANGQVAFAADADYRSGVAEPYNQIIGNAQERSKTHQVKLIGLRPATLYHYQLRSKGAVGPLGKTRDFTFTTKKEELEIVSYSVKILTPESAQFRWITSSETDTSLRYIPFRGNVLAVDEAKARSDENMSLIHEVTVEDLEAGVIYNIELSGKDAGGRVVTKLIEAFVTAKDNLPPVISQVRTDSMVSPGKEERIQVIVSWQTNEPSNSLVYFQRGIAPIDKDPSDKTQLDANFTKKHVVLLSRFEPGQVYSFKVESADSLGNTTKSQLYSILTPKKKETIFDIILRILEETFGWIGTIRK